MSIRERENVPANNKDDIGGDDEGLAAVDITELPVLFQGIMG